MSLGKIDYLLMMLKASRSELSRFRLRLPSGFRLTLSLKGLILISVPFTLQIIFFINLVHMQEEADLAARQEYRSRNLFHGTNWLATVLLAANLGSLAHYLYGEESFLSIINSAKSEAKHQLDELQTLFANDQ